MRGEPGVHGLVVVPDCVHRQEDVDEQEPEADHQRGEDQVAGQRREAEQENRGATGVAPAEPLRGATARRHERWAGGGGRWHDGAARPRSGSITRPRGGDRMDAGSGSQTTHGAGFSNPDTEKPFPAAQPAPTPQNMPILLLLLSALVAGLLIGLVFDRFAPAKGATAAAADVVETVAESSAQQVWWRARTDPAVTTGLALDSRCRADDRGRVRRRVARPARPRQRHRRLHRRQRCRLGQRARHPPLDARALVGHGSRGLADRPPGRDRHPAARAEARPESLSVPLPAARLRGRQGHHEWHQGPGRSRAADAQPDRRDSRPVFSQRPLLDGGLVLRGARIDPRAATRRARASAARGQRRQRSRSASQPAASCSMCTGSRT